MIERYAHPEISEIWTDEHKLNLWLKTELAVILAKEKLKKVPPGTHREISESLLSVPIDIEWWKKRDKEIHHDLNAFLDERFQHLAPELHQYFHVGLTSYDTEEAPQQTMMLESLGVIKPLLIDLQEVMMKLARDHKHTVMNGRTHGQEAKLQSFGKRVLTWIARLNVSIDGVLGAEKELKRSKLSGAIGNYQGLSSELEEAALKILGFEPYYGATQIMPRELHAALSDSLVRLVYSIGQIAEDIRLGSRSGVPICHEPFGKKQKGSSAMPHKKNTIRTEQLIGMTRVAEGFGLMLRENIMTWEERAIEQSSVERIAWPDLFHVVARSITVMTSVVKGLVVYPENMLKEIESVYGAYASEEAKDFLKEHGFEHEDAYRIVQLASFNAFDMGKSIEWIISRGLIRSHPSFEYSKEVFERWKRSLHALFKNQKKVEKFYEIFSHIFQLRGEEILFEKIKPIDIPM